MLHQILEGLNYLAKHFPWEALAASGVISPLLVGLKKWLDVQSERVMITLVALVSGLAAVGNYLLHVPTSDPSIIAVQASVVAFLTQPVYFFVIKPAFKWFGETLAAAAAFKEAKSAIEPTAGLTTAPVPATNIPQGTVTLTPTPPNTTVVNRPIDINDFRS